MFVRRVDPGAGNLMVHLSVQILTNDFISGCENLSVERSETPPLIGERAKRARRYLVMFMQGRRKRGGWGG